MDLIRERYSGSPMLLLGPPNYYDSPEGHNPWEKIWGVSKYAVVAGTCISIYDCFFQSRTQNIVQVANVTGFWMLPLVGMSATFASITYMATNIRGKDDQYNYAIGALACSPILYNWTKSLQASVWGTIFLIAAAVAKKDSKMNGWQFYYDYKREYGCEQRSFLNTNLVREEWPRRPF